MKSSVNSTGRVLKGPTAFTSEEIPVHPLRILIFYGLPLFLYCLLIFVQSSHASPDIFPRIRFFDKFLHFSAWAVLGVLFFRFYHVINFIRNPRILLMTAIISASAYGLLDEVHQSFVSERTASLTDFAADTVGSIAGVLLYARYAPKILLLNRKKTAPSRQRPAHR